MLEDGTFFWSVFCFFCTREITNISFVDIKGPEAFVHLRSLINAFTIWSDQTVRICMGNRTYILFCSVMHVYFSHAEMSFTTMRCRFSLKISAVHSEVRNMMIMMSHIPADQVKSSVLINHPVLSKDHGYPNPVSPHRWMSSL